MVLTAEQQERIRKNREEALRKAAERKAREAQAAAGPSVPRPAPVSAPSRPSPVASVASPRPPPIRANLPKSKVQVEFKLAGPDKFKITFHPFHSAVNDAIKQFPSRSYSDKDKSWSLALADMEKAEKALNNLVTVDATIEPIPENVLRLIRAVDKKEAVPSDLSASIDPSLLDKLFAYQRAGLQFGLEKGGRVLIADEMGLGKSVQALAIARYYRAEWPLLIVCPSSVKAAWSLQFNNFLPSLKKIFILHKGSDPLPDARTSNTVVIMSYEQMVQRHKQLKDAHYNVIIFDESHMCKDTKAKRTIVATDLSKMASRVILLSGTPALSRPAELFSQVRLVNDRLFTNFMNFALRYCDGKQGRFAFEAKGCTNSEELSAILQKRIMIRRLKANVLTDLPDKRREVVYLSGDSIDTRMDSLQRAKQAFEKAGGGGKSQQHDCLLEYYNQTGIVKAAAVCAHILDNYFYPDAPPRKVLVFGHHQIVLDTITMEVSKRGLRSIRIDGSTSSKDRGEYCRVFQEDPCVQVAVLSLTAAGVGITLTAASVVVFAELHWNPGTLMQAEDRAHRVGQKDSVFVQYMVARNTADDKLFPLIQHKMDILGQVNLSSDTFRTAEKSHKTCSDYEDIAGLFRGGEGVEGAEAGVEEKENPAKRGRFE